MRGKIFIAVGALAALASLAAAAQTAERITLRNGFEMRCNHHAQVEGRVRLYLGAGEDSYIEFAPEEIAGVEQVPDPPAPPASAPAAAASPDAGLSPPDLPEMLAKAAGEPNL